MADLEKTIKIILQGVDKDASRTFANAVNDLETYKGAVTDITGPLADMSKSILKVEAAVFAAGAAMIGVAINEAGKFETQVSEILTLFNDSPEAVGAFEQSILDYARSSTASLDDINAALYSAISAGVDYQDSVVFVGDAEALATAGRAELEATTRLLASSMNAYGDSTDQAARYSDAFMKTVQLGQITIPELADGLSRVTGIAAAAGVPIEVLTAAIAEMTKKGDPASLAMTGLQGALAAMIKPSEQAKTLAAELGIEFGASALQSKGFEGVLQDVAKATGGNVEQIGELFGSVQGLTAVLKLVSDDGGEQFINTINEMTGSAGTTAEALEKIEKNFANINQTLKNQLTTTMIEIGKPLLDGYKDIAIGIGDIFQGVSIGMKSDAFNPVFDMLDGFMRDVGQYLQDVAKVMPEALAGVDFSGLMDSLGELGGTVKDLFQAIFGAGDLTEAKDLEEALQRIVNGVTVLTELSSGILEKLQPLADVLGEVFEAGTTGDSDWTGFISSILGVGFAADVALNALDGFTSVLATIAALGWAAKTTAVTVFAGAIKGLVVALGPIIAAAGTGAAIGTFLNQFSPVQDVAQSFAAWTDKLFNWTGQAGKAGQAVDELNVSIEEIRRQALTKAIVEMGVEVNTTDVRELQEIFDDLNEPKDVEVVINQTIFEQLKDLGYNLNGIPDELFVQIMAMADIEQAEQALLDFEQGRELSYKIDLPESEKEKLTYMIEQDGVMIPVEIEIDPETPQKINDVKSDLEMLKLEAKIQGEFDIEKMKASAETMQAALKFKAEVDIAQLQAEFSLAETIAQGLSDAFQSTGDVLASIFSNIGQLSEAGFETFQIDRILDREYKLREKALDAQILLNDAQIKYFNARADALSAGDALIKIEGDGLSPHIEAFMWEILSMLQVRVNEEGMDMLLGAT